MKHDSLKIKTTVSGIHLFGLDLDFLENQQASNVINSNGHKHPFTDIGTTQQNKRFISFKTALQQKFEIICCMYLRKRKKDFSGRNPRRHAAGQPFHAFLTGWLGEASPHSDSGERVGLRREVERRVERARFSAWRPRPSQREWFPRLPWVREALL